jgi:hypothetical protein
VTNTDRAEVKRDGEESSPHRRSLCAELGASRYLSSSRRRHYDLTRPRPSRQTLG